VDSRLQAVELKLMDLEVSVEQLNQVVIRHETTIDLLKRRVDEYQTLLQSVGIPVASSAEEPPPPHY